MAVVVAAAAAAAPNWLITVIGGVGKGNKKSWKKGNKTAIFERLMGRRPFRYNYSLSLSPGSRAPL